MDKIKFETTEEIYRRLVKEQAKKDPLFACMQMEIETDDILRDLEKLRKNFNSKEE